MSDASKSQGPILRLVGARGGHFLLESGHHGDLWLPLERLFVDPSQLRPLITDLAAALRPYDVEAICGPLIEGAFVGLQVAVELNVPFSYSIPQVPIDGDELFPVRYIIPPAQKSLLTNQRIAIVNDVINAGSAVLGTLESLATLNARVCVVAALLTLGETPGQLAHDQDLPLVSLEQHQNSIWVADDCPLCAAGQPFDDPASESAG